MSGNYQHLPDENRSVSQYNLSINDSRNSTFRQNRPSVKATERLQSYRIKRRINQDTFSNPKGIIAPAFIREDLVDQNKAKKQRQRFLKWRDFDLIALLFSLVGFILATVDYETNFYPLRQKKKPTEIAKVIVSITTVLSVIFIFWRHSLKRRWLNESLPYKHKFCTTGFTAQVIFILIQPIPFLNYHFKLQTLQTDTFDKNTFLYPRYYVNQILYAGMASRFILIIRNHFNYSIYNDANAKKVCSHYGFSGNMRFSLKAMLLKHPGWTALVILGSTILVLTFLLRIFERPYFYTQKPSNFSFDNFFNALWCLVITMTTVGYGDMYPVTYLGKSVAMIACLWGAFVISLTVVVLSNIMQLPIQQKYAVYQIALLKKAKKVIKSSFQLSRAKNDERLNPFIKHEILQKEYVKHYNKVTEFLKNKEELTNKNIFGVGGKNNDEKLTKQSVDAIFDSKILKLKVQIQQIVQNENAKLIQQITSELKSSREGHPAMIPQFSFNDKVVGPQKQEQFLENQQQTVL